MSQKTMDNHNHNHNQNKNKNKNKKAKNKLNNKSTMSLKQSLMNKFSDDIKLYFHRSRPSPDEITERERLERYIIACGKWLQTEIEKKLKQFNKSRKNLEGEEIEFFETMKYSQHTIKYGREWEIFTFGSESWGTSTRDSDIDMGIFVNFSNTRPQKKHLLHCLAKIIGENDNDGVLMIKELLNAKYPIIRITEMRFGLKVDVSIADRFCSRRDSFINDILHKFENNFHIKVKPLIVFIKYWSKQKSINNAYYCYLNSFGYTLLVIKFLQYYCYHTHQQSSPKTNCSSLSHLVYKFFEFYSKQWNPSKHAIIIRARYSWFYDEHEQKIYYTDYNDGDQSIFDDKQWFKEINGYAQMQINDPINNDNNVAMKIGQLQCQQIKYEFQNAYHLIKDYRNGKISNNQTLFNLLTAKPIWQPPANTYYQPQPIPISNMQQQQQPIIVNNNNNNNDPYQQQMDDMRKDQQYKDELLLKYADGDIDQFKQEKKEQKEEEEKNINNDDEQEKEEKEIEKEGGKDEDDCTESPESCDNDININGEIILSSATNTEVAISSNHSNHSNHTNDQHLDVINIGNTTTTESISTISNDGSPDDDALNISDIDKIDLTNEELQKIEWTENMTDDSIHSDMNINNNIASTYNYELTHDVVDENVKQSYRHDISNKNMNRHNNINLNHINNGNNNNNNNNNNYNHNQRNNIYHGDNHYYKYYNDRPYDYHKSPFKGSRDDNNHNNHNNNSNNNNYSIRKRRDRDNHCHSSHSHSHHLTERKFSNNSYNGYSNYNHSYNQYNSRRRRRDRV